MPNEFFLRDIPSNFSRPKFDEGRAQGFEPGQELSYEVYYPIQSATTFDNGLKVFNTRGTFNIGPRLQYFVCQMHFTRLVFGMRSTYLYFYNPFPIGIQCAVLSPIIQISQSDYELDMDRYTFPDEILALTNS